MKQCAMQRWCWNCCSITGGSAAEHAAGGGPKKAINSGECEEKSWLGWDGLGQFFPAPPGRDSRHGRREGRRETALESQEGTKRVGFVSPSFCHHRCSAPSLIIIEFLSVVTIQREFLLKVDGIVESHASLSLPPSAPLRNGGTHVVPSSSPFSSHPHSVFTLGTFHK